MKTSFDCWRVMAIAVVSVAVVDSARAASGVAASADGHGLILSTQRDVGESVPAGGINPESKRDQAAFLTGEEQGPLVQGIWPGTYSAAGMIYHGQATISLDRQRVLLNWSTRYQSQGMDGLMHQVDEQDLFAGQLEGRTLKATREHVRIQIDGIDVPQMQTLVQLSATISADGRSLEGTVTGGSSGILKLLAPSKMSADAELAVATAPTDRLPKDQVPPVEIARIGAELTGQFAGSATGPDGEGAQLTASIKQVGNQLRGSLAMEGEGHGTAAGLVSGNTVHLTVTFQSFGESYNIVFRGAKQGGAISGKYQCSGCGEVGSFQLTRQSTSNE